MIIDMHVHTEISGDSSATVEKYCRAIQRYRQYRPFDGIVLTEHRVFQSDDAIQRIGEKYDIMIFQGIEIDADFGHLLLYGITDQFLRWIDITQRRIESKKVIKIINDCGGIAIPAHPFRESNYGTALTAHNETLNEIKVVEEMNGSNFADQNEKAEALVERNGLKGIGGSDAHYVNKIWFLNCATEFDNQIRNVEDLVRELRHGHFRPVTLDSSVLEGF
jgi:predicted metal-dependent phosphoesterase TrpH